MAQLHLKYEYMDQNGNRVKYMKMQEELIYRWHTKNVIKYL